MYWLDIGILILLGWGLIMGLISGLLWQVGRVVTWVLSIYLSIVLNPWATEFLQERVVREIDPVVLHGVAYVGIFLVTFAICHYILHKIQDTLKDSPLAWINRLLGGLLGLAKMALLASAVCAGIAYFDVPATREWFEKSKLASHFAKGTEAIIDWIPEEHKGQARITLDELRGWATRTFAKQFLGEEKE